MKTLFENSRFSVSGNDTEVTITNHAGKSVKILICLNSEKLEVSSPNQMILSASAYHVPHIIIE